MLKLKNVLGLINLSEESNCSDLQVLTDNRCIASVPYGGRYRIIDFILSSLVNSGIYNVGVITLDKYRSLIDHLSSGKEWDLHRKRDGLFILPPLLHQRKGKVPRGGIQYLYDQLDYLEKSSQPTAIVTGGNMIYNIDFREALSFHREMKADITVFYREIDGCQKELSMGRSIVINEDNAQVESIGDKTGETECKRIFLNIIIMDKRLLIDLVKDTYGRLNGNGFDNGGDPTNKKNVNEAGKPTNNSNHPDLDESAYPASGITFIEHGLIANLPHLKIMGFPHRGYLATINSLNDYYRFNMELLDPHAYQELFFTPGPIYTKSNDEPPTKYGENAKVHNTLIANGCEIDGTVRNSIIFRGVKIEKGASVKNSIIFQNCTIGKKSGLENVILDKNVLISEEKKLRGTKEEPVIVGKQVEV